jgi:YspA, cpYpsA-related SLOG family
VTRRILVTGSRTWTRDDVIYRALAAERHPAGANTLIHGKAPGTDPIADHWARQFGWLVEPYPAEDFPSPRDRNQHMVDTGADVCLAFATSWASGTGMCARMARRAGIPVTDFGVDTSTEARP